MLLAMPAGSRLSASERSQFTLKTQLHALKAQQGLTLETMAEDLRTFQQRAPLLTVFHTLFPRQAPRAIQQAVLMPPTQFHEQLLEAFLTLVGKHLFPVDDGDMEYGLEQFPRIPIAALNHDEESDLEGEYLATQIAATIVGYYGNAPSWDDIQHALGPTIQIPSCFTDAHHQCRVNIDLFRTQCQHHPHPVSDFPTILQIVSHDTGSIYLDISYCYEVPEHGYEWTNAEDIQALTQQWNDAKRLTKIWLRTAKRLDAEPRHWQTIFACWQHMCEHETRNGS